MVYWFLCIRHFHFGFHLTHPSEFIYRTLSLGYHSTLFNFRRLSSYEMMYVHQDIRFHPYLHKTGSYCIVYDVGVTGLVVFILISPVAFGLKILQYIE